MANRLPAVRRRRINDILQKNEFVSTSTLSELLDTSLTTIRRDLEWLDSRGFVIRTHGGALSAKTIIDVPPYSGRALTHFEEKRKIGMAAVNLAAPGDIIFLNTGTTVTTVAQELRQIAPIRDLTIVTDNIHVALELHNSNINVVMLGGLIKSRSSATIGSSAISQLRTVYGSKCILGVSGINTKFGLTQPYQEEAAIDRLMIFQTRGPKIVVADHSKWGLVSSYPIASIDQIDILITDSSFPEAARAELEARSVEVIIAEHNPTSIDSDLGGHDPVALNRESEKPVDDNLSGT